MNTELKNDINHLVKYVNSLEIDKALKIVAKYTKNLPKEKDESLRFAELALQIGGMKYSKEILRKLSKKEPNNLKLKFHLATAHLFCNDYHSALKLLDANKDKYADNAGVLNTLASCYSGLGEFQKAEKYYKSALKINPQMGIAIQGLVKCRKFTKSDDDIIQLITSSKNQTKDPSNLIKINKSLAKIMNDLEDYEKAWSYASEANEMYYKLSPFQGIEGPKQQMNIIQEYNKNELLTSDSTREHILIVGMPRSGTTLLEQIIGSHSSYFQGGETPSLNFSLQYGLHSDIFSASLKASKEQLNMAAKGYDFYYEQLGASKNSRIINKVPANYMNIGFFKQVFPKGKIIFMERDYRDVVASIYFEYFSSPNSFTNKVDDIIKTYKFAKETVLKWNEIYNEDILLLKYEDIISEYDQSLEKISSFLNVQKDDMPGHSSNKSVVNTPSLWQVRQKVYSSSSQRFLRYSALKNLPEAYEN